MAAVSLQDDECVPMCSICADLFRDPVTLPCQHDFCRPCLQMLAEMSEPATESYNSVDVDSTDQDVPKTETCPVCRSPAELGSAGFLDLPTNIALADVVRKFQAEENTCGQKVPKCSVCEDDNSSPGAKSCQTCNLLYCQDCFLSLHPMRGALKHHHVITIEEFISMTETDESMAIEESVTTDISMETDHHRRGSAHPIPCDKHGEPLSMFCVSCQEVMCLGCLDDHNEHITSSIKSAYQKLKAPMEEKTEKCRDLRDEIDQLRTEMNALYQDIEGNEDAHKDDIERAYTTATEALNCWRRNALEKVEKRHSDWRREWKAAMKDLDMKAEELERMIQTWKDLVSSLEVMFLKGSKKFKARVEEQLPGMRTSVKRQEEVKTKMRQSVRRDRVIPRRLLVKESTLSKPELKFSATNHEDLKMTEDGSVVEMMGVPFGLFYKAWTDVCLPPGNSYWEMDITIGPTVALNPDAYHCIAGVKHKGSDFSRNASCWWIGFHYNADTFRCGSYCRSFNLVSDQWRPHTGSHKLGFYLETEKHTLTVIDRVQNQAILILYFINVSEPLVVAVNFWSVESASARLITGHSSIVPRAIYDIVRKTT